MANETCNYECKPHIGTDGFWYVGAEFTGVRASGNDGITPRIGVDGYWYIGDKNQEVKAVGESGAKGEKGDKGEPGEFGKTGPAGPQGATGPQGLTGPQGPTGATGPQGATGSQGATGPQGATGATGPKGNTGDAGAPGLQGMQGAKGDKGDIGAMGPVGPQGAAGAQGIQGLQGLKGDKGEIGAIGPVGPQGIPGPVNIANDLTTDIEGYALDARQGKELKKLIDNSNASNKLILALEKAHSETISSYGQIKIPISSGNTYLSTGNLTLKDNKVVVGENVRLVKVSALVWVRTSENMNGYIPYFLFFKNDSYEHRFTGLNYNGLDGYTCSYTTYIPVAPGDELYFNVGCGVPGRFTVEGPTTISVEKIC